MSETIAEILENGIIVAADEEAGFLVQANGSYFNLYSKVGDPGADNSWNKYACVDCTANGEWGDMNTRTAAEFMERGRELLDQWMHVKCPDCERDRVLRGDMWHCATCDEGELELMAKDLKAEK